MNASKENCDKARAALVKVSDSLPQVERHKHSAGLILLDDFLEAAKKRLPSEVAIAKDRERKKARVK